MELLTAYRQLAPSEKVVVDCFLADLEQSASRTGERLFEALGRPLPRGTADRVRAVLDKPLVKAAVAERAAEITERMEISASKVIRETAAIAFSNISNYFDFSGGEAVLDMDDCSPEQLSAVKSIEIDESTTQYGYKKKTKLVLHDKLAAINNLMKYMGLLEAGNSHWAAVQDRQAKQPVAIGVPDGATTEQAGDLYARQLG